MGRQVKKTKAEICTIDCELITITTADGNEFGFDTADQIAVEPQIEEVDGKKLVIKGILRAQKKKTSTLTGHEVVITDNVFIPELVLVLQGGVITYDPNNPDEIVGYRPPLAGSLDKGESFTLNGYSAQYDASGQIVKYEQIMYPNCEGVPIAFSSKDGEFRASEYTIISAPKTGEAPYDIAYVHSLPVKVDEFAIGVLNLASVAGTEVGSTKITVLPIKDIYSNVYFYKTDATTIAPPVYGTVVEGYTVWDGKTDIVAATGQFISIIEANKDNKALSAGVTEVVSKA